jgi:hypothetical protein
MFIALFYFWGKMKKEEIIEIIKRLANIKEIEEDVNKISFKLDDSLTRKEVEAIVTQINNYLSNYGIVASPFGVPFKRGFHIKKKYLY